MYGEIQILLATGVAFAVAYFIGSRRAYRRGFVEGALTTISLLKKLQSMGYPPEVAYCGCHECKTTRNEIIAQLRAKEV